MICGNASHHRKAHTGCFGDHFQNGRNRRDVTTIATSAEISGIFSEGAIDGGRTSLVSVLFGIWIGRLPGRVLGRGAATGAGLYQMEELCEARILPFG